MDPREDITRILPVLTDLPVRPSNRRVRLSNSALQSWPTMLGMWERGVDGPVDTVSYRGSGVALHWDDLTEPGSDAGPLEPPG